MSTSGSSARNLRITLVATAVLGGAGLVSGILSNRLLGPTGRGQLAAVQTAPALLATVGALGMAEALVYNASRTPQRSRRLLGGSVAIAVLGGVVASVVGWFGLAIVLRAQSDETLQIARYYLLGLTALVLALVVPSELRASGRFLAWNVWRIAPASMWAVVVVVAIVAGFDDVRFLVYTHLGLVALLLVPAAAMAFRSAAGNVRPQRSEYRDLLRFGVPVALQTLPQLLNLRLDQFLISATLPATDLGLYAAAVNWCVVITLFMDACGFVLFPSLAAIDDEEVRLQRFCHSARLGVAVALGLAVALALITPTFLTRVLGPSFEPAIPAAFVLVAANAVLGWCRVLGDGVRGLGVPAIALRAEIFGLCVAACSLAVLLGPFGIRGAAIASLVAYSGIAAAILFQVERRFGVHPKELVRFRFVEVRGALAALRPARFLR